MKEIQNYLFMKKLFLLIAIAFMAIQANAQAPSNGLVAYYNFENTLASHVPAHSFTNGTVSNLTYSSAGKVGSCANFLGSQALFNTTMIATGNLETNCTIAWWELRADPTPANGSTSFQMKEALTYSYFGTSACSGATFMDRYRIDFETLNGSFVNYGCREVNTHTGGNKSTWVHHALIKEGSKLSYYMNGVLSWTPVGGIDMQTQFFNNTTSNNFILGGRTIAPTNLTIDLTKCSNAKIDELYVYGRALTGVEINGIMNNGITTAIPLITKIGSYSTPTNTQILYNLYGYNLPTTSVINYGLTSGALTSQVAAGSVNGLFEADLNTTISNLTNGTTYYYQIKATNAMGDRFSPIHSFIAGASGPVVRFPFDNNTNSADNAYTLSPNGGTPAPTFVTNRFGETNKAVYLNNNKLFASIPVLPVNRQDRTVSFWVKRIANQQQSIFGWGSTALGNAYGVWFNGTTFTNYTWGSGYDYSFAPAYNTEWTHFAISYEDANKMVRMYKNGVLQASASTSLWISTTLAQLYIGSFTGGSSNVTNMYLDDFEVFNTALSEQSIYGLYTIQSSNTLATNKFQTNNLKATIYPNPTSTNFTIEMENEVKSVEIYSLQGQKVLNSTAKNINVSGLSRGMYLVQIEDENNNRSTQKLIVE